MKKQEETRQAELSTKAAEFKALQAQAETVRLTESLISAAIILWTTNGLSILCFVFFIQFGLGLRASCCP